MSAGQPAVQALLITYMPGVSRHMLEISRVITPRMRFLGLEAGKEVGWGWTYSSTCRLMDGRGRGLGAGVRATSMSQDVPKDEGCPRLGYRNGTYT